MLLCHETIALEERAPAEAPPEPIRPLKDRIIEDPVPFFEALVRRSPLSPGITCFLFGALLIVLHAALAAQAGADIRDDWSWMLGVICGTCLYLLCWAALRLRRLVAEVLGIFCGSPELFERLVYSRLRRILSNGLMLRYALFFAAANCLFGLHFGIPYRSWIPWISMMSEIFIAGCLCGMAFGGIVGVIRLAAVVSRRRLLNLDISAPDTCGGTGFIGKTMLQFSLVTLLQGLLIAGYIYEAWWQTGLPLDVRLSIWFWMVFPHCASGAILVLPVMELHRILKGYRNHTAARIEAELAELRRTLHRLPDGPAPAEAKSLMLRYDELHGLQKHVEDFNTWPYDRRSRRLFLVCYVLSLAMPAMRVVSAVRVIDYLVG